MLKKLLPFLFVAFLTVVFTSSLYADVTKLPIEVAAEKEKLVDERNPGVYTGPTYLLQGDAMDSPGTVVGKTFYDYQTNCSTGDRIVKHDCGVHICYMNGIRDWTGERVVYYNFVDDDDPFWGDEGTPASSGTRDGYTTITQHADEGYAIIAFHNANPDAEETRLAIDASCGLGLFTEYGVPSEVPGEYTFYWPYVAYDNNGNIHVINHESEPGAGNPQDGAHTYSSDLGNSWEDLVNFETLMEISAMPVASQVDDKVAIVFTWPRTLDEPNQYNNDICYIESEDGVTWDYDDMVNITNYQTEDTIRAYCDVDACYDYEGNLHIIWNTPGYWEETGMITADACFLWHWSEETGINMIYDAWHASFPGAWNRSASKYSIAANPYGPHLHVLWTHFDDIDVSAGGWSNGELYLSSSTDNGVTWDDPTNLTETVTPGCLPGDCDSDHWSTLAPNVDNEYLYIMYINDKDAGGIPQDEGAQTQNPVMYLKIDDPYPVQTGIEDEGSVPSAFNLTQNYPNPFNASTNITFSLKEASAVNLTVYNLLGEEVAELVNGKLNAGEHSVTWNAGDYTSGVYFYKLNANGEDQTRRMVLLK